MEFQVNSYTDNNQSYAAVATAPDGDFVVVWHSYGSGGTDTSFQSTQSQRFASDGTAVGNELQVNTYTTSFQGQPAVAVWPDGDFLVVWESLGSSGDTNFSIQGQRFASDGAKMGVEFQVNTFTTSSQRKPSAGVMPPGDFVVVWQSVGSSGTDNSSYSIQGQRFASDGNKMGAEFQVNTYTNSHQLLPAVQVWPDGKFVVVWQSDGSSADTSFYSIQGQRFASDGNKMGAEFQVNTYTTSSQLEPSVALLSDDDFVVAWESFGSSGTDNGSRSIQVQRFASDGTTVGGELQVNTYTTSSQRRPSVAPALDGGFVVVWHSSGSSGTDTSFYSIQSQQFASDGTAVGGELQVNTYTPSNQSHPTVAALPPGDFVVTWQSFGPSDTDNSAYGIRGQRFTSEADLAITKDDSPDPVDASAALTYTVDVSNLGPSTATSISVDDTLPPEVSFVSAMGSGWSCIEGGGVVTCARASLTLGAAPAITITVTAPAEGASLTNDVAVSAAEPDPVLANNSASETSTVMPVADLSVTQSDAPDPVAAGAMLRYMLQVSNAGPSTATAVTVADTLPAGVSFVGAAGTGWACGETGGVVSCTRASLSVGVAPAITITAPAPPQGGMVTNSVAVNAAEADPGAADNTAAEETTVTAGADLAMTKDDGVTTAVPGQSVTYTVVASNAGPSDVAVASVTDALPESLTCEWASAAAGGATGNTSGSGQLSDTLSLPAGSSVTYTVACVINTDATGTLSNTATISSAVNDPVAANDSATDIDTLSPIADLTISKAVDLSEAGGGEVLTYTVAVANQGPSAAPAAVLEDAFPIGLACDWTSVAFSGATGNTLTGAGDLSDVLSLPAHSSVVYTATCEIDSAISGTLRNTARIASQDDPDATNSAIATTEVEGIADLEIELSGPATAVPGTGIDATFTVFNQGPQDVVGARILAFFPPQLDAVTWFCAATTGGSCTAGPVAGDLDDFFSLPAGASATYTVTARVIPGATGNVDFSGTLLVPRGLSDPDPLANVASSIIELRPEADLAVSLDDCGEKIIAGKRLRIFVTIENSGPSDAPAVELTTMLGELPEPLEEVRWACTSADSSSSCDRPAFAAGTFCGTGTDVLDETFPLLAGESRFYRLVTLVGEGASGMVRSTATVESPILELDASDNTDLDEDLLVSGEITALGDETVLVDARSPDIDVTSSGLAVVVYERQEEDGSCQVYRQELDMLAMPVGEPVRISEEIPGAMEPAIAFNADLAAGVRNPEDGEAALKIGDAEATLSVWPIPEVLNIKGKIGTLGRLFDVTSFSAETADRSPDCASLLAGEGDDFLAVWQRAPRSGGTPRILARPIDAFGPSEPELEVSSQGSQAKVAARTNRQFLVVWRVGGNIRGQRVKHDGQLIGGVANVSNSGNDSRPHVAYHRADCVPPCPENDRFLVLWRRDAEILGRLYDKNMQPKHGPLVIADVEEDEAVSLVGTEGGSFVVSLRSEDLGGRIRHVIVDPADGALRSVASPAFKGDAQPGEAGSRLSAALALRGMIPDAGDSPVLFVASELPGAEAQDIHNQRFVLTADLVLEITAEPVPVFPGETLTYTMTVSNVASTEARNVQVTHSLSPGSTFIASSGCAQDPNASATCTLGAIPGDSLRQYVLTTAVDPDLEELVLELTASAGSSTFDADESDNTVTVLTPVGAAGLALTIAGPAGQVVAGSIAGYVVTVRNAGPSPAAAAVLSALLPTGTLAVASDGCAEDPAGIPQCALGSLAVGEEREVELTVEIAGGVSGTVAQAVRVAAATFDPELADNVATATVAVVSPEIAIVPEAPVVAVAGNTMTVTATVANHGEAAAAEVVLSWVLPPALTPLSSSGCEEDPQGAPICTLGTLQAGELRRVDLELEIDAGFSGTLALAVNATSPSLNSVPTALAETTVTAATVLPLLDGRFAVRVDWRSPPAAGAGRAVPLSGNTGFFWFFAADNTELVVKVLDGRGFNDHFWFIYGALSDVEYDLTVTDLETGVEKTYHNPAGNLCGQADILAFPADGAGSVASTFPAVETSVPSSLSVSDRAGTAGLIGNCVPGPESLCLSDGRFRVEVDWRDQHDGGTEGAGQSVPGTDDSGAFWFFDPRNLELAVKVLDGRPINGRFWVFYGGLSDIEYRITVTDTETEASRTYHNPPGEICGGADIEAF